MSCPQCSSPLELDGDGGWCSKCGEYFPNDIILESMAEEDQEEDCSEYPEECDGQDPECKKESCPWFKYTEPPL